MPTVLLGNTAVTVPVGEAQAVVHSGDDVAPAPAVEARPDLGQQITHITPSSALSTEQQVEAVVSAYAAYSSKTPAWVEGDDDDLVAGVAARYDCPIGCPDNGDPDVHNHDTWKEG